VGACGCGAGAVWWKQPELRPVAFTAGHVHAPDLPTPPPTPTPTPTPPTPTHTQVRLGAAVRLPAPRPGHPGQGAPPAQLWQRGRRQQPAGRRRAAHGAAPRAAAGRGARRRAASARGLHVTGRCGGCGGRRCWRRGGAVQRPHWLRQRAGQAARVARDHQHVPGAWTGPAGEHRAQPAVRGVTWCARVRAQHAALVCRVRACVCRLPRLCVSTPALVCVDFHTCTAACTVTPSYTQ
jgi:hypothetical protein